MPAQYLAIREALRTKGFSMQDAKKHAAMIYNSLHPKNPNPWAKEKKRKAK
jgi:lambda repressor-like predicted transcriptional regulator